MNRLVASGLLSSLIATNVYAYSFTVEQVESAANFIGLEIKLDGKWSPEEDQKLTSYLSEKNYEPDDGIGIRNFQFLLLDYERKGGSIVPELYSVPEIKSFLTKLSVKVKDSEKWSRPDQIYFSDWLASSGYYKPSGYLNASVIPPFPEALVRRK